MSFIPQPFVWTHEQEMDLIELGERPARMLKGENRGSAETRARLLAGRAHRGLEPLLVERRRRASRLWFNRSRAKPSLAICEPALRPDTPSTAA